MAETNKESSLKSLRDDLIKLRGQFKMALPPHINAEKFERTVITSVQNNPKLARCDRGSFWAANMKAASDGLLPDGRECAIVPFKDKQSGVFMAQYIEMVGGVLKKIRNSGELASIGAHIVHTNDQFKHWVDETGEHLYHEECLEDDQGKPKFVYCLAILKDKSVYFEKMTKKQVEAVRSCSHAPNSLKWTTFWEEGWKVSVTKRIGKRLPASTDIDPSFFKEDGEFDFSEPAPEPEKSKPLPLTTPTQSKRLKAAVKPSPEKKTEPKKPSPEKLKEEKQKEFKTDTETQPNPEPDREPDPEPEREPGEEDETYEGEEGPL